MSFDDDFSSKFLSYAKEPKPNYVSYTSFIIGSMYHSTFKVIDQALDLSSSNTSFSRNSNRAQIECDDFIDMTYCYLCSFQMSL